MVNAFLHRYQNRITAESAEELAEACKELGVTTSISEGYAELTDKQYEKATLRGIPRVESTFFFSTVNRMNEDIDI